MEHFYDKKVKYIGHTSKTLEHGKTYDVSHTYAGNVAVITGKNKFTSTASSNFEIVGENEKSIQVHALLMYENQILGVRFKENEKYYDVEGSALTGVTTQHLKGYKIQTLKPHGDLLITDEELNNNIIVSDKSKDKDFCRKAVRKILNRK